MWLPAFPGTHMEVTHMFAHGAYVITEVVVRATHTGTLKNLGYKACPSNWQKD